ncbi:hypothetical protein, partial [Methylorubrum podarium]|uniref:hypothetical protein n=1 Tax=Methylorubrum podarium TaxID=200476 RepID=UPI001EE2448E
AARVKAFDLTMKIYTVIVGQIEDFVDRKFGNDLYNNPSHIDKSMVITAGYMMERHHLLDGMLKNISTNVKFVGNYRSTDSAEFIMKNNDVELLSNALSSRLYPMADWTSKREVRSCFLIKLFFKTI